MFSGPTPAEFTIEALRNSITWPDFNIGVGYGFECQPVLVSSPDPPTRALPLPAQLQKRGSGNETKPVLECFL